MLQGSLPDDLADILIHLIFSLIPLHADLHIGGRFEAIPWVGHFLQTDGPQLWLLTEFMALLQA